MWSMRPPIQNVLRSLSLLATLLHHVSTENYLAGPTVIRAHSIPLVITHGIDSWPWVDLGVPADT